MWGTLLPCFFILPITFAIIAHINPRFYNFIVHCQAEPRKVAGSMTGAILVIRPHQASSSASRQEEEQRANQGIQDQQLEAIEPVGFPVAGRTAHQDRAAE